MSVAALGMLAGPSGLGAVGTVVAQHPAVSLCPRGAGLSPQAARTGLLQHLSLSQALKQTIVKPLLVCRVHPHPPAPKSQGSGAAALWGKRVPTCSSGRELVVSAGRRRRKSRRGKAAIGAQEVREQMLGL